MFRQGQRVQFSIKSTRNPDVRRVTLPGVVVGNPTPTTRPGTNIQQMIVPIVTLREAADGSHYLKKSDEIENFVSLRGAPYVPGLDIDDDGTFLSVAELQQNAYAHLQAYLEDKPADTGVDGAIEELPDAPLTTKSGVKTKDETVAVSA